MSEAITKAGDSENAKNEGAKDRRCLTAKVHPEPSNSPSQTRPQPLPVRELAQPPTLQALTSAFLKLRNATPSKS
ncbi:hypothetical protein ES708_32708 [subsurface metagenome]